MVFIMPLDSDCSDAHCLTMYGLTLKNPKVTQSQCWI